MGGERMTRGPTFSPPTNLPVHKSISAQYYTHQPHGNAAMSILATPSPYGEEMCGPSPFLPDNVSPSLHAAGLPPGFDMHGHLVTPPEVLMHNQVILSPTDQMVHAQMHGQHMVHRMHNMSMMPPQHQDAFQPFGRPHSQQGPRPNVQRMGSNPHQRVHALQRPQSHPSSRPGTPQYVGDVFDPAPQNRPIGMDMNGQPGPIMAFDFAMHDPSYGQGISPIRALGPAPVASHRFSPPHPADPNRTPTQTHMTFPQHAMSSASSAATTVTASTGMDSSSTIGSVDRPSMRRGDLETSDEESDSPTKPLGHARPPMTRMPLERPPMVEMPVRNALPPKKTLSMPIPPRPARPLPVKPLPAGGAGRTSAKFAKVAEDPGVEGVPPGPRPTDRPGPSFACIIGQAILRSSAGGLSLEHIYRYVETAYPFFKSGDGAWRNSVRHNLSIHKMFETIPRTEKFPPGKGGIWIIHEDEKCHWPEDDKFIKNFPSSHPHHGVCRQTLHERAKEQEARDKAAREGKAYVPKKGKKGRKNPSKDDDDNDSATEMGRTSSMDGIALQRTASTQSMTASQSMPPPSMTIQHPSLTAFASSSALPSSPPRISSLPEDAAFDFDDDGDFVPIDGNSEGVSLSLAPALEPESTPHAQADALAQAGAMAPPRFDRREKKPRDSLDDDENVFSVGPKRVRMAEPSPLSPVEPQPQPSDSYQADDDMYITPARERTAPTFSTASAHGSLSSSAFKTPALVQTSSSPGSSPMPPTVGRGTAHHPSSLQQAWTHDDMVQSVQPSASSPAGLDAAFDFKPRASKSKNHMKRDEDLGGLIHGHPPSPSHHATSVRVPPKTPVTRSSAAAERTTPRLGMRTPGLTTKTPLVYGSPAVAPPSTSAHLSTPLWEMGNILERMKQANPPESPLRTPRSPVPSTSPTRYSILLDSGASPKHRRDFSL